MNNPALEHLKARARILHRQIRETDPTVQRKDCLATIAREHGFTGWPHAVAVLSGEETRDFGTLLYPRHGAAYWNIWSAHYEEAARIRAEHGGFLLAYKTHFFITDQYFVEALGLDPDDPDWERIGRDWARPADLEARTRLYAKLLKVAA